MTSPKCGTYAGMSRHRRRYEEPCAACKQAAADYVASWRRRTEADGEQRAKARRAQRWRAIQRLIDAHPDEFNQLLREETP